MDKIGYVARYGVYAHGNGYNLWDHLEGEFVSDTPHRDLGVAWFELENLVETLYWQKHHIWHDIAKYPEECE